MEHTSEVGVIALPRVIALRTELRSQKHSVKIVAYRIHRDSSSAPPLAEGARQPETWRTRGPCQPSPRHVPSRGIISPRRW